MTKKGNFRKSDGVERRAAKEIVKYLLGSSLGDHFPRFYFDEGYMLGSHLGCGGDIRKRYRTGLW